MSDLSLDDHKKERCKIVYSKLNINSDIQKIIIVYSLPKVGSTSLITSLRIFGSRAFNLIHVHDENMLEHLLNEKEILITDFIHYLSTLQHKVYVIDIYRSPIERKISDFFEKITLHFNTAEENINKHKIETLIDRFQKIFNNIPNLDPLIHKYNIEIGKSFDFEKKYNLFQSNNITYISLRLKDSKIWGEILSGIFEQKIMIISDYETNNKIIKQIYNEFKKKYLIPINYLESISSDKDFNYYYDEEEKKEYLDMWKEKITDEYVGFSTAEYKLYINIVSSNNLEDKIKSLHYKDEGCLCMACSKQRAFVQSLILQNKYTAQKIHHGQSVDNYLLQKAKILNRFYKKPFGRMQIF